MKKLFLLLIAGFLVSTSLQLAGRVETTYAASCNYKVTNLATSTTPGITYDPNSVYSGRPFRLDFPNLWPNNEGSKYISYKITFPTIRTGTNSTLEYPIERSKEPSVSQYGNPDGVVTINGLTNQSGDVPFVVVATTDARTRSSFPGCDGTLNVKADPNSVSSKPSGSNTSGGSKIGASAACVQTDLGCIPTDPGKLASAIFSIILGLAGGLAILMIIIGGFKVATSQGNVDALQDGRDTITKAITGLAFILLATTILGIIGIDILGIPFFRRDGTGIIIK